MRRLFVDANIFIRIIFNREHSLLEHLIVTEPYTSIHVLEEASYKLIGLSIIESQRPVSSNKVRKLFEKEAAEGVIRARLAALDRITRKMNVTPPTYSDFRESMKIALEYKPLPSDALISAIMKREEIKEILTLDSDFKRIP